MMLSITSTKTTLQAKSVKLSTRGKRNQPDLKARYVQLLADEATANVPTTKVYGFFTHDELLTVELRDR